MNSKELGNTGKFDPIKIENNVSNNENNATLGNMQVSSALEILNEETELYMRKKKMRP